MPRHEVRSPNRVRTCFITQASSSGISILTDSSLAYAEIYMTLAHIVRRFEFAPYETTAENISVRRSLGTGVPMDRTFDVRAKVVRVLEE